MAKGKHAKKIGRVPVFHGYGKEGRVSNPPTAKCECEHISHFGDEQARQHEKGGTEHEYAKRFPISEMERAGASFFICNECAETHVKNYLARNWR